MPRSGTESKSKVVFEADPRACKLCKNSTGNRRFSAQEKMFAQGGEFVYLECAACKALMLMEPPANMAPFYPKEYYSFVPGSSSGELKTKVEDKVMRAVIAHRSGQSALLGATLASYTNKFLWVRKDMFKWNTPILDVGCGHGALLLLLQRAGFTDLTGADPFIEETITYTKGLQIEKKELHELDRSYGFIMMNHTFEHLADPAKVLRSLYDKLDEGGRALIRIPVGDSHAWRHYGIDWVQLDAPRHFFLHTVDSMRLLVAEAGLELEHVEYDSTDFQFIGSEKYRRDQPLDSSADFISGTDLQRFQKQAKELNEEGTGDTASFYLRKG